MRSGYLLIISAAIVLIILFMGGIIINSATLPKAKVPVYPLAPSRQ